LHPTPKQNGLQDRRFSQELLKLPREVGEGLVGFGHAVHLILILHTLLFHINNDRYSYGTDASLI
jgi:hypothetical protein